MPTLPPFNPLPTPNIRSMLIPKDIDLIFSKLPCGDAFLEQQVQFGEGAAAWFGHTEVCVDDAEEADCAPEETGVVAPVGDVSSWRVVGGIGKDEVVDWDAGRGGWRRWNRSLVPVLRRDGKQAVMGEEKTGRARRTNSTVPDLTCMV